MDGYGIAEEMEFDATPWFEQASKQQLRRLKPELQSGRDHGETYHFYSGEQTDDIFGWMSEKMPDKNSSRLLLFCEKSDATWSVTVNADDVRSWELQQQATKVATGAVDKLLGL